MHTLIVLKLALVTLFPASYIAPWVNGEATITYKTQGKSAHGRAPWNTEKLGSGLPVVIDKGRI
jgi:hypothetical protein